MYTYDEVLASGYYVFRENLNTDVLGYALEIIGGKTLLHCSRTDNKIRIDELSRIIEFNDGYFKLKDGSKLEDIKDFIKEELVIVFQQIKNMICIDSISKQYKKNRQL